MLKSDVYQNSLIALVTDEAHVIPKWLVQNFITGITLCLVSKLLCYSTYLATYIAFNIRTPPVEKSTGCPVFLMLEIQWVGVKTRLFTLEIPVGGESKLAYLLGVEFHRGMKNLVWRNV